MTRALIVIDVQESFRARPLWETTSDLKIADQVNRLVRLSRQAGDLVVWVCTPEPGSGDVFDPALGHVRLMEELERADGEPLIHKTSHNAFTTTNLPATPHRARYPRAHRLRHPHRAVRGDDHPRRKRPRLPGHLGHRRDRDRSIPHRDAPADQSVADLLADPRTLPAEEVIRRTEYALAGRFATISTIDQLEAAAGLRA